MQASSKDLRNVVPIADQQFFEIFLPREMRLVQKRWLDRTEPADLRHGNDFLGLFVVRLRPMTESVPEGDALIELERHLWHLVNSSVRTTDFPGRLGRLEYLVVAREMSLAGAPVIAQRLLDLARQSRVFKTIAVGMCIGFVAYPFIDEPDLPPADWPHLVDIARMVAVETRPGDEHTAYGVLRGEDLGGPVVPESEIVSIALRDMSSLTRAELLRVQHVLAEE
jgi:hypothetical protein